MPRLLVIVPGLHSPTPKWRPLLNVLQADPAWREDTELMQWEHQLSIFSRRSLFQVSRELADSINFQWIDKGPFDEIVIVGHSTGALLARQAYLIGLGSALQNLAPQPWAAAVKRIVLISGINAGVELNVIYKLFLLVFFSKKATLRDLITGSDFITNLRIWWLKKLDEQATRPIVVQVRGALDSSISAKDSLDVEGFVEGHQLVISGAGHDDLMQPDRSGNFPQERFRILRRAILLNLPPHPSRAVQRDANVKVFFVVHGIRDGNNDWVEDISARIKGEFPGAVVITPDVGRFSALQFLIPATRRREVRWFQKVYSRQLAKNPLAQFYFVGHSYGTYLLGYSLRRLSGMAFERVYMGGSVLPATWQWDRYDSQVHELRNASGKWDVPVGILCGALSGLRMRDIGTAGYTGFRVLPNQFSWVRYYPGGHGASVAKGVAPDILEFLKQGNSYCPGGLTKESKIFTAVSAGSPLAARLCAAGYFVALLTAIVYPPWHPLAAELFVGLVGFSIVFAIVLAFF